MLTMSALAAQGLPHSIQPQASADHTETGWEGGFERDGSERYRYESPDGRLTILVSEHFSEEPNTELEEDDPDYWAVNKEWSDWTAECRFTGSPELVRLSEFQEDRQAFIYNDDGNTAREAVTGILPRIPYAWFQAAGTSRLKVIQGWNHSYGPVAGSVHAPMWI